MAIKTYQQENKTFYEVYVSHRSSYSPSIRAQRRKKGVESKGKAERLEKELLIECLEEVKEKEGRGDKWGQIVEKYKAFKETFGNVQQDTLDDYYSMLKMWTSQFWDKPISEVTKSDVRNSIENAKNAGKSNSFLTKILHTTGRVYKWAREEGLCPNGLPSIISGIMISKIEERAPQILTWEQIQYLLEQAKIRENDWYPIWAMAVLTGMRNGELYALKWDCVDLDNDSILIDSSYNRRKQTFKSTKSGLFRRVPVNDALKSLLIELKSKTTDEFVLPRMNKWSIGHQAKFLGLFCEEIGLPKTKFHTLRACFATHLLSKGVSLTKVMKCAGWSELKTVQKYNRLAGVSEKGATDCLNTLAPSVTGENVLKIGG
jgi:integrase